MKYLILTFILINNVWASSCCGGGSSSALIIVGDNKSEYSFGYSFRNDIGQTNSSGYSLINSDNIVDQKQSYNIQGQFLIYDYTQLAMRTSFVTKNVEKSGLKEKNNGLNDMDIQLSYEYLPEFTYHPYKPRAFFYTKLNIPFSKSLYNSNSKIFSDVRGSGLYSIGIGNFFVKRLDDTMLKLAIEWNHVFGKNFGSTNVSSSQKFVIPLGISYTFPNSDFTFGLNDSFTYQTQIKTSGLVNSTSSSQRYFEIGAFINYSPTREHIYSLTFSDSSLIGKSINSALYRSIALNFTLANPI